VSMVLLTTILSALGSVLVDLSMIVLTVGLYFTIFVRNLPVAPGQLVIGAFYILVGLALLRTGLDISLIPVGLEMASQLAEVTREAADIRALTILVLFAGTIGFAAALIEPALTTMARRAQAASGGAIPELPFRVVVATGVGAGLALGALRIHFGIAFEFFFLSLVLAISLLSWRAPRLIRPIAYDSGAVATSVVVVPLVTALGLGIASALPGRSPLVDGFGIVTGALLLPVCTVLFYARVQTWRMAQSRDGGNKDAV